MALMEGERDQLPRELNVLLEVPAVVIVHFGDGIKVDNLVGTNLQKRLLDA